MTLFEWFWIGYALFCFFAWIFMENKALIKAINKRIEAAAVQKKKILLILTVNQDIDKLKSIIKDYYKPRY